MPHQLDIGGAGDSVAPRSGVSLPAGLSIFPQQIEPGEKGTERVSPQNPIRDGAIDSQRRHTFLVSQARYPDFLGQCGEFREGLNHCFWGRAGHRPWRRVGAAFDNIGVPVGVAVGAGLGTSFGIIFGSRRSL
jgi:hypothetical protein